jgi:hypothetical protein
VPRRRVPSLDLLCVARDLGTGRLAVPSALLTRGACRYYTIGGGIGHTFWSSYYQNYGAPETYLLGFMVALANM